VKLFKPNPTKMSDGTWQIYPGAVEITFYLHKKVKAAFLEIFPVEAKALGVSGDIEFVETPPDLY
jgi:hypothetical protein